MLYLNFILFAFLNAFWGSAAPTPPMHGQKKVIFKTHDNINQNFALKTYIVQIFSQAVMQKLQTMTAEQFKLQKEQLTNDYPDEISIWEIHLVENDKEKIYTLPCDKSFWGVIVFLEFQSPAQSKFVMPQNAKYLALQIENEKCTKINSYSSNSTYIKLKKDEDPQIPVHYIHDSGIYKEWGEKNE